MKRRFFTLVELLVGFVILSLVFTLLLNSFYEMSLAGSQIKRGKKDVLSRAALQHRLSFVFSNIVYDENSSSIYVVKNEENIDEFHFKFLYGVDPNPRFSGKINGLLTLKDEGFCLVLFSNHLDEDDSIQKREEIIKKGVKDVRYEFLHNRKVFDTWDKEKMSSPDYVKIVLFYNGNKEEEYALWIKKKPIGVFIK
jgi:hypothetical protein